VIELNMTLVAQILNFLILLVLLTAVLTKPIKKILAERQSYIENNITAAEENRAEAERLRKEYETFLENTKKEAQEMLREATKQAQANRDEIIAAAQKEATAIIERANAEIEREKNKALAELRDQVTALAVLAAGKIIEKNLDEATHQYLVNDFIEGMGKH